MTKLKFIFLVMASLLLGQRLAIAQGLPVVSIEECYTWAEENYPLIKQLNLIDKTTEYNLNNAAKGYLPQVSISGQVTYQSEVTRLPLEIPNMEIPVLDKNQYKVYAELYQPLTNGLHIKSKQEQLTADAEIKKQEIEVELHQLEQRVNQLYFSILLFDNRIDQFEILKTSINNTIEKTEAAAVNGIATETDVNLLRVEGLSIIQKIQESESNKKAFLNMLAALTAQDITESTELTIPVEKEAFTDINRPEISLFELQHQAVDLRNKQVNNRLMPDIGLFGQSGYGKPALNFLSNNLEPYYLGGLRFNWNLSRLYTSNKDKQILDLNKLKISSRRETFLLNTKLSMTQQTAELEKFNSLIASDREIIQLRTAIRETAEIQLENGIISTLDYVNFIQAENNARQSLVLHKTRLLLSQYNLKTTSGN